MRILASLTALKEQRHSTGNDYGTNGEKKEHTTARKRRLMLLDDAAMSSINFNRNGSAEFGSALRGSARSGVSQRNIQY